MKPVLKTLEHLCYVIECVAVDCTGEAKSELSSLCDQLESNPDFRFEGSEKVSGELRLALAQLRDNEKLAGAGGLGRISRQLWRVVLAPNESVSDLI